MFRNILKLHDMASLCATVHFLCLLLWNLLTLCEGRYYHPQAASRMQYARQESEFFSMDILMPGIIPNRPEEYLCYGHAAPTRDSYIVKFDPKASMKTIHHMLVYGCGSISGDTETVVSCNGSPCRGKSNIMFGWARDADSPGIPKGVGFHVGGSSGIEYIVIQLHYGDQLDHLAGTSGDHSGISLLMTHTPQPFIGGIYLLYSGNINIPPHSQNTHVDVACKYNSPANIHPFAFRTHSHSLGKVITGYLIRNGEWSVIAKGNPQWPQAFYPMVESYTIQPGDILAARCTYDSDRDGVVHAGGTHTDEMCNLYIMYYTDATRGEAFQDCGRSVPDNFFLPAPGGYDTPPLRIPTTETESEPHSRYRPPALNPWDPYYDQYGDPQGYYPESYLQEGGSNNDYPDSPQSAGRGGELLPAEGDAVEGGVTEAPAAPETGGKEIPLSAQNSGGEIEENPTEAAPEQPPQSKDKTGSPPAANRRPVFTVNDVAGWPESDNDVRLGQVSGVAVDSEGNVHIFHRASRPWDMHSFTGNVFSRADQGPIVNNTVIKYDSSTGAVLSQWGANQFFLPHGLSIDHEDNIWLTDVGMHQVFKYPPGGADAPLLTLGKRLEPGNDLGHFCKPSDVAVDPKTGNFFVSDGYCNARVMKFSPDGKFLLQWGHQLTGHLMNPPIGQFNLPHCITMVTDKNQVCVADREVGRIQCFSSETGDFSKQFNLPAFGGRLYALAYTPSSGGLMYAVNGPSTEHKPVRGFAINFTSSEILQTWKPQNQEFEKPHDIACTPDGKLVYVAEIGPNKVWKFTTNADLFAESLVTGPTQSMSVLETIPSANSSDIFTGSPPFNETQPVSDSTQSMSEKETTSSPFLSITGNSSAFNPVSDPELKLNESGASERVDGLASDGSLGTTTIIVAVLAVPILLMLLVAVAIRMHAQGHFRRNKKRRNYKVSPNDKFSLGSLLHKRNGFSQVATDDSDPDAGQWSEESDIEEYSILNNSKRTQNL